MDIQWHICECAMWVMSHLWMRHVTSGTRSAGTAMNVTYAYIYMYSICMYAYICIYTCIHIHIHTCIHIRSAGKRKECPTTYAYIHGYVLLRHVHPYICVAHICIYILCIPIKYAYIYIYLYIYMYSYDICIHIYVFIHIHVFCIATAYAYIYVYCIYNIYVYIDRKKPPPRGGFLFTMFPDQEPCVRDFTMRCDRRISSWNLLHTALDQETG